MSTPRATTRRRFLAGMAAAGTVSIIPRHVLGAPGQPSANNRLNIVGVGVGGMGANDIRRVPTENVVAICDVDQVRAANMIDQNPQARLYRDFRVMLDEMAGQIDAVAVSTPDHTHHVAAMAAIERGKHV